MVNKRWFGRVVLAGSVLAGTVLTGGGGAADAATPGCLGTYGRVAYSGQSADWRVVQSTTPLDTYGQTASVVSGPSSIWLFACAGTALHDTGSGWTTVPLPAGAPTDITAAAASSPAAVWAFAAKSGGNPQTERALFYNGRGWALAGTLTGLAGTEITTAAAAGPADVWATSGNTTWHYNGKTWTKVAVPFSMYELSALPGGAQSGGTLWATGYQKSTPVVGHWTGLAWTVTPMSRFLTGLTNQFCAPQLSGIYAQRSSSVWVAGGSGCQDNGGQLRVILHWNGHSWTALAYHGKAGQADSLAPDGSGGLWISTVSGWPGFGGLLHESGGKITAAAMPKIDGVAPSVTLQAAPGGGGPVFGAGFYYVDIKNTGMAGTVIIERR